MVDIGWVVLAFFCGGYTGMLLLAVAAISRQNPPRSIRAIPAPATASGVPGSLDDDVDAALDQDVRLTATSSPMLTVARKARQCMAVPRRPSSPVAAESE